MHFSGFHTDKLSRTEYSRIIILLHGKRVAFLNLYFVSLVQK